MDENISNFVSITGASADVAGGFLQLVGGDFERAVGLYFENPDLVSGVGAGIMADEAAASAHPSSRHLTSGRQDESGVIHISDDDDDNDDDVIHVQDNEDDVEMTDRAAVAQAVALAQEEEDAAMAKRLQEELYQGGQAAGNDGVRAPIARTTETLVAPEPGWAGDDEMASAFLEQMRRPPPPRTFYPSCFHVGLAWAAADRHS